MMLKSVQAYFPSEDKAESAKTLMVRYNTETVEISRLGNPDEEEDIPVIMPFTGNRYPVSGVAPAGTGGGGLSGGLLIRKAEQEEINNPDDLSNMSYVLSTKVEEEDYDAIVNIINNNQGEL